MLIYSIIMLAVGLACVAISVLMFYRNGNKRLSMAVFILSFFGGIFVSISVHASYNAGQLDASKQYDKKGTLPYVLVENPDKTVEWKRVYINDKIENDDVDS